MCQAAAHSCATATADPWGGQHQFGNALALQAVIALGSSAAAAAPAVQRRTGLCLHALSVQRHLISSECLHPEQTD